MKRSTGVWSKTHGDGGRWKKGMREQRCCSAPTRESRQCTSSAAPEIQMRPWAQSLLYHRISKFCLPECRQEPNKYLYHSQNCLRDHKQYISFFSWTDEKMFSVESPETVSNFLNRDIDVWTHADNGSRLFRSDIFNAFKICVLLPCLQGQVCTDRTKSAQN